MTRIAAVSSIPDALGDLFAAATNGRRPPLVLHSQMASAPAVLAAYAGIRPAIEEHAILSGRPTGDDRVDTPFDVSMQDRPAA
jgi:hypothetical protein